MSTQTEWVSIGVKTRTREQVESLKRGGETYDELLRKMADQYDPEATGDT